MHSVAGASALAASEGLPVAVSASSSSSLWVLAAAVPVLWTELWTRLWVRLPDCDEKYRPQSPHCWQTCLTRELTSRLLQQQGTIACAYCIVSGLLDARLRHSCRYLDKEGRGLRTAYSAYTRRPVVYLSAGTWSLADVRSTLNSPSPLSALGVTPSPSVRTSFIMLYGWPFSAWTVDYLHWPFKVVGQFGSKLTEIISER